MQDWLQNLTTSHPAVIVATVCISVIAGTGGASFYTGMAFASKDYVDDSVRAVESRVSSLDTKLTQVQLDIKISALRNEYQFALQYKLTLEDEIFRLRTAQQSEPNNFSHTAAKALDEKQNKLRDVLRKIEQYEVLLLNGNK